ncbi:carbohydrate-binding module family 1 protein [Didymella exigua CBS 183.55]|uniref:Carbohydrate-binding module family 1 protein n=1 Tax=Didymella exigua CBS 183.55 TaxID=1150837 RepID=A0A6A5RPU1_9PLEO|nr:carbohydrate-binding module family 1 protein [Didymella exigua CBS 183.55]KAF1929433.1 carbohydrate-binding module family 1 protein [Didymella exigua CBS 183.55]
MRFSSANSVALLAGSAYAVVGDWQQCGGINWSGETSCAASSGCVKLNDYYSQCQPGAVVTTLLTSTKLTTTAVGTSTAAISSAPAATGTPAGSGPGTTLQSGYYWIRAVAEPNFHKYMQTKPMYATGTALLDDYTTAGQFQVVDGQLVQLVSAPGAAVQVLYAVVSETRYINDNSLSVTFSTAKNTYGQFAWQGDGLTWNVASLTRPNSAAWYVCTGQQLYINLGNYLYQTPAGCADQTIHYYNDLTANS